MTWDQCSHRLHGQQHYILCAYRLIVHLWSSLHRIIFIIHFYYLSSLSGMPVHYDNKNDFIIQSLARKIIRIFPFESIICLKMYSRWLWLRLWVAEMEEINRQFQPISSDKGIMNFKLNNDFNLLRPTASATSASNCWIFLHRKFNKKNFSE